MSSQSIVIIPVLTGSIAVIGANSLALSPIAPAISSAFDSGIATTMLASVGYGIGTALGALFLSWLIDSLGARSALWRSLAVMTLAFAGCAAAPNVGILIASQVLAGLAAGVGLPAIYAFAASVAPTGQQSVVVGRVLIGWTISMVAGVSLSAVVADLVHWRGVYIILAVASMAALLFLSRLETGRRETESEKKDAPGSVGVRPGPAAAALGLPGVPALIFICLAYMIAFYGTYGYIGDHVHSALDLPVSASGALALIYGIGFGAAAFADKYIDRFGVRRVMPWCFVSISLIYALLGLGADTYGFLAAACLLWGLVNHFGLNLIVAGLCSIDASRRGAILGLNSAATYCAASLGVLTFGPVYESHGFSTLAFLGSVFAILAAAISLSLRQYARVPAE